MTDLHRQEFDSGLSGSVLAQHRGLLDAIEARIDAYETPLLSSFSMDGLRFDQASAFAGNQMPIAYAGNQMPIAYAGNQMPIAYAGNQISGAAMVEPETDPAIADPAKA